MWEIPNKAASAFPDVCRQEDKVERSASSDQ
jgi:hypothetical protein